MSINFSSQQRNHASMYAVLLALVMADSGFEYIYTLFKYRLQKR